MSVTTPEQPAFVRVYRAVVDEITSGRLQAGDRLPTERTLGARHGVSRATVRRAIEELAVLGLVERPERRRAFVAGDRLTEPPNALLSFTELGRRRGLVASARLLERSIRPASLLDADGFGLEPGAPLVRLRRLRFLDDEPIAVDEALVPLELVPGLAEADVATLSLYGALEAAGRVLTTAEYDVTAIPAQDPEATLLGMVPGAPALVANTRSRDAAGRLLEVSTTIYRGDRYRFQATLTRPQSFRRERTT
jgi:GntR family transcriptional regulator